MLFVCLGNICRSPMAHGLFRAELKARQIEDRLEVDSCGTGGHHAGEAPNAMMQEVALRHGINLSDLRSRQLCSDDYREFDLLVAMDRANEQDIQARMPEDSTCEVLRFMQFVPESRGEDIPDPWWAGRLEGFEHVFELLEAGTEPLIRYAEEEFKRN